uniref:Uncharacterized protein n=1 Tax=Lepeophtheirus salmonis TaxID=72036 RepID=A0A0K2V0U6_LEPSM
MITNLISIVFPLHGRRSDMDAWKWDFF